MTVKSAVIYILPPFFRQYAARIESSPLGYRLARGTFWSLSGALISRGLALFASVLAARILGKSGFGELGIIQSTVGMFGVFAGFGMGVTATKHVAEFREKDPKKAGRIMALSGLVAIVSGGIMALALFIFAPWLAAHTLAAPHLSRLLKISAGLLFLTALNGAQTGALAGLEAFKTIAKVNLIAGVVTFPCIVGGVYLGGLEGAVWGLVASTAWNWFLNHLALRKEACRTGIPFSFQGCLEEGDVLWRFSLPAMLTGIMVTPVNWSCQTLIARQNGGYDSLGLYFAIFQIVILVGYLNSILGQTLLPILSNVNNKNNLSFKFFNILSSWGLGLVFILPIASFPEFFSLFYGKSFSGNDWNCTLGFCMLSASIIAHRQGIARSFIANGILWLSFVGNSIWGISAIIFTWLLADYGASGLAAAYCIAYIINTILFIPFYIKKNICPKELLFSIEAFTIWLITCAICIFTIFEISIIFRVIITPFLLITTYKIFFKIWKQKILKNKELL